MECYPSENVKNPRKRPRLEDTWKRAKLKKQRYGPIGPPIKIQCNHGKKGKAYRCTEISPTIQKRFHELFYDSSVRPSEMKNKQDFFILKYTDATKPKRARPVSEQRGDKSMVVKYFIYDKSKKLKLPVCRKAFLDTLRLSEGRVKGVVKRHFETGLTPKENRGGDRKTKVYEPKRNAVTNFIKKFQIIENHYCRSKSANRQYLQSDLSIKKMWRLYNAEAEEPIRVKQCFFRHVFRTKFNIGFGSPRTDECSTCISLQEKIKNCKDARAKQHLLAQRRCHKLKAKSFYNMLKETREDLLTFSFDCQKNQVLPRVPDQSAYYSRQLYKYNATVVLGHSKAKHTKENVFIYEYDETEHKKGANEISSVVYDFLNHLKVPNNVKTIRIMSDGCGGQNKNTFMMGMLSYWLKCNAPVSVKSLEYVFPVVGHSFLPSDRVFARIEKEVKRKNIIINPEEYTNIFSDFGTVRPLPGKVFDWKTRCSEVFKLPGKWHFQFNSCKRFYFKISSKGDSVLLKGEPHYRTNLGKYKSVCLKGKKVCNMPHPDKVDIGVKIAPLKLRDVDRLLGKHFGDDWKEQESLSFYKNCLQSQGDINDIQQEEQEEERDCDDFFEEVPDLVV